MTFKKFEFWLITLVALIVMIVLTFLFVEEVYSRYVELNNSLPDLWFYLENIGVKICMVFLIYIAFLFQNYIVLDRLYKKRKYDLMVVLTIGTLLILLGAFYYFDALFPNLFRNNDYIPIIISCYGGYLFYTLVKALIQYFGDRLVPGPLKRKITGEVILAFGIWFLIFITIQNAGYEVRETLAPFWGYWVPCAFMLIMLNIYWVIPYNEKGKRGFSSYLVKASLITLLFCFPFGALFADRSFWSFFFFTSTQFLMSIPLAWFIYQHNKERIAQLLSLKKELGKTTADLQFLRSQINPHFLFNALNTLYGTAMRENSERTAEGIQKLGDMMRFMLHENVQNAIPLEKEIEYLWNFINLQQLRIQRSDDILIDIQLHDVDTQYQIAPMLLIPFVENAFKHGISLKEDSWIKISLSCKNDQLYFDVYNSIHSKKEADPEKDRSGIGLANVKQRLEMIYPERHELIIRETAREFIVHLTVALEKTEPVNKEEFDAVNSDEPILHMNSSVL